MIRYYKAKGAYDRYREELEYLAFVNVYFEPSKRMALYKADKRYLLKLQRYIFRNFPEFQKNPYVREMSWKVSGYFSANSFPIFAVLSLEPSSTTRTSMSSIICSSLVSLLKECRADYVFTNYYEVNDVTGEKKEVCFPGIPVCREFSFDKIAKTADIPMHALVIRTGLLKEHGV